MPQIAVDHSAAVLLDAQGFALAAHALAAEIIGCPPSDCKTRFRPLTQTCVADGAPDHALVVGEIRILPGRPTTTKTALSEGLLSLLADHITAGPGQRIHLAWDVVELDRDTYRRADLLG